MASYERYKEYASLTAAELAAVNNIFPEGQLVVEADTGKLKVGDGVTAYNSLPFAPSEISSLTLTGGTATTNTPVLSATQTWNNAAVTFTGWQLNVTDTASAAASLLMNLQIGGASRFLVTKGGVVRASNQVLIGPAATGNITGLEDYAGGMIVKVRGSNPAYFDQAALQLPSNGLFGWTVNNNNPYGSSVDTVLARDAANTLAQRNGVNAQTLRVYNTFTDASNYERGFARWGANVFQVGAEAAGTGTARDFEIVTGGATRLTITASGSAFFSGGIFGGSEVRAASASPIHWNNRSKLTSPADGIIKATNAATTAGSAVELDEMTAPAAPAANSVRIYAVDNGSGKTQLMALFATGAAQQIAIEP